MAHSHHHHHHHDAQSVTLEQSVLDRLHDEGLRLTAPRRLLVRVLAAAVEPVPFAALLEQLGESFDRVTLYRNLGAFEQAGVLQCVLDAQSKTRYELTRPHHHHHHVVCRQCGEMECLPECDVDRFTRQAEERGYLVQEHRVEVYGLCPKCRP